LDPVSRRLPSGDFGARGFNGVDAAVEALADHDVEFDLGHVQPTAALGGESDLMGKTGQQILRAMVAGERDGAVLARMRDKRVKADELTLARSLEGTWREEHLFALEQAF